MPANQVKHDATIDVARGFTGRDVKVREINLSHHGSYIKAPTRREFNR